MEFNTEVSPVIIDAKVVFAGVKQFQTSAAVVYSGMFAYSFLGKNMVSGYETQMSVMFMQGYV